jgi:hypothetical protein
MKNILRTTIVCLLIPSLVFAQIPQYRTNEPSIKQTDLSRVWNALNTEMGQEIVSYIETTVGSIDLEHAKAFTTAKGEVAFVPIKSFSRVLAALCYRQLEDGSEYLFLITYNATQKGVSFTFPSGRMYVMKATGVKESANPDFQFQEYNDLNNRVNISTNAIIDLLCSPFYMFSSAYFSFLYDLFFTTIPHLLSKFCGVPSPRWNPICDVLERLLSQDVLEILIIISYLSFPLFFIVPAFLYQDSNLEMISILFAVYYYGCYVAENYPYWT